MIYLALICTLASSPVEPEIIPAAFNGTYQHTNQKGSEQAIHEAIDSATEDINFLMRSKVRSKLKEKNKASPSFSIQHTGKQLTIQNPFRNWTTTLGAQPTEITLPNDRIVRVSTALKDRALIETIQAEKIKREHRFKLSADGQKLQVQITIVTSKLSKPIQYELTYQRQNK